MTTKGRLLIAGAGGHGRVILEAVRAQGRYQPVVFFDTSANLAGTTSAGLPVIVADSGRSDKVLAAARADYRLDCAVVAIGDPRQRRQVAGDLAAAGLPFATVIHPRAWVAADARLGQGTVICALAAVGVGVRLGSHSIVNTSASVDHDCVLESYVHVAPGAHLGGSVHVGEASWVGLGASVRESVTIGRNAFVGAGAAVVEPVADDQVVVGVPARPLRKNEPWPGLD